MYHCHIRFCFAGRRCRAFEIIKGMTPLEHFTHEFSECEELNDVSGIGADVVLANLRGPGDRDALQKFLAGVSADAEVILLVGKEEAGLFLEELPKLKDLWTLPMSEEEIRFRFLRWQQTCKMSKDYWQTSHYLDVTINHVPNLVWYKTKDGIHEKVNDSFCQTVNKTKEQVEGRGHAYIWDVEQDDPACIESEREVMTTKRTCVSEETVMTGDGTRLLTTYKSPLYDLDGSVMGTVGVAIDVTQERTYEQEIIKRSRTLETIFTTMDCGIMSHSMDGSRIISVNEAALKILGYKSQKELIDDGFDMVAASVLEEDKLKLRQYIQSLKRPGDSVSLEYRVGHKNGEILHVMGNVKILEENGELFYQRFLLDCTAQKLQEKKNERHQMELIHALSTDYSLVCFFDLHTGQGMSLRISEEGEELFGSAFLGEISLEKSMEDYIEHFVYEEDREMLRQASALELLEQELAEKKIYYVNYRIQIDGVMKYFQMKAVRAGEWEESRGVVLGFRSVDEEIRNEMEQKSLLEDALMQANRANKAKSTFLSNMSHDIRTPMNAIVGFTTLAIAHIDRRDQVEEYLKKIMTSGNHLLSLINDVLDMSHPALCRISFRGFAISCRQMFMRSSWSFILTQWMFWTRKSSATSCV